MELRLVRAFLAVVAEGSITAASRRLHVTQSALSRQIKGLEDELGVALFERGAHSVSLTPAGEVLVRDAERWVQQADQIADRVRAASLGDVLKVGYAPSLAGSLLGPALERFAQLHAGVRVQLSDCSTAEMKAGLRSGDFDLILTVPEEGDTSEISWQPVERRSWRLAVGASHEWASLDRVEVASLATERFLMFRRDDYPDYWKRVTVYCKEHGLSPKVVGEFDGYSSLSTAVESGMGVAFVAEGSSVGDGGRLRLLALDPEPDPICIAAGFAADTPPGAVAQVLVEELKRGAAGG